MKTAGRENPNRWTILVQQPSTWCGRSEPILLHPVGCEARKIPADAGVFFLDFYLYRTSQPVAAPKSKSNNFLVLAAAVAAMIVVGSWYTFRQKAIPSVQAPSQSAAESERPIAPVDEGVAKSTAGAAQPASATPIPKDPAAVKPATNTPKKPESIVADSANGALANAEPPAPNTEATPPELAALNFNPKSLDPKANCKAEDRSQPDAAETGFYSGNEWEALFAKKRRGE